MKNKKKFIEDFIKEKGDTTGLSSNLYIKDKAIINYNTRIAYFNEDDELFLNTTYYSQTTRVNQKYIREVAREYDIKVHEYEGLGY